MTGVVHQEAPKDVEVKVVPPQKASAKKGGASFLRGKKSQPPAKKVRESEAMVNPDIICFCCHQLKHCATDCKIHR